MEKKFEKGERVEILRGATFRHHADSLPVKPEFVGKIAIIDSVDSYGDYRVVVQDGTHSHSTFVSPGGLCSVDEFKVGDRVEVQKDATYMLGKSIKPVRADYFGESGSITDFSMDGDALVKFDDTTLFNQSYYVSPSGLRHEDTRKTKLDAAIEAARILTEAGVRNQSLTDYIETLSEDVEREGLMEEAKRLYNAYDNTEVTWAQLRQITQSQWVEVAREARKMSK